MKTSKFIVSEMSKIQDRRTMLSREFNHKRVKLNPRGVEYYQKAIEALMDAYNHLKIAEVNNTEE
jgi:hypothetical protein